MRPAVGKLSVRPASGHGSPRSADAAVVLLWRRRAGWLLAFVVAASALAAVVIYSHDNVGN
jgi:hypothetical protein